MQIFPQLSSSSVSQFPIKKTLRYRTIANSLEDGSRVVLEDPNAAGINWELSYAGLTDTEIASLQAFFESMSGRLQEFTFLDPTDNLITWSEDFSQAAWQKSTFLQSQSGTSDPWGTQRATTVTNSGAAPLELSQSAAIPGSYLCCLSCFVRSNTPVIVALSRGSQSQSFLISAPWMQISFATTTSDGSDTSMFGLVIPAGASVDVFGFQVQPQLQPSTYVQTLDHSGVYPATRFDADSFTDLAEAPNNHSCAIRLYSRLLL